VGSDRGKRLIASGEWIVFRTRLLRPAFLRYFVISNTFHERFMKTVSGVGGSLLRAKPGEVAKIPIPVPPLSEQERIVKLLDEADELRKLRAQADSRTAQLIPALFDEMFGDPVKNSVRCPFLPLGEIVDFGSGATPSKERPEFWNGKIPWVSPKDMKAGDLYDSEDHVSDLAFQSTKFRLYPRDTVLIVVRGMILAHTVPICVCRVRAVINQDMKALLPKKPIDPDFLRWSLISQHPHLLNRVSTAAHGTKKLDSDKLRALPIPIAPLPQQKEFAKRVNEIREFQAAQAASRQRTEDLFQSMLYKAFNGEI
jgi:type I restriction enzyme S subunit